MTKIENLSPLCFVLKKMLYGLQWGKHSFGHSLSDGLSAQPGFNPDSLSGNPVACS